MTALRGEGLRASGARCAVIFQRFDLVGQFRIFNNVLIGCLSGMSPARSPPRLWRAAIARAPVVRPSLVLADELIASLAPRHIRVVTDALQRLTRHYGIAVPCNLPSLARGSRGRLVRMAGGRVAVDGPASAFTAAAARDLYGAEADEALDAPPITSPVEGFRVAALA